VGVLVRGHGDICEGIYEMLSVHDKNAHMSAEVASDSYRLDAQIPKDGSSSGGTVSGRAYDV